MNIINAVADICIKEDVNHGVVPLFRISVLFRLFEYSDIAVGGLDRFFRFVQALFVILVKAVLTPCFFVCLHIGGLGVLIDSGDMSSLAAVVQTRLEDEIEFIADFLGIHGEQCFDSAAQIARHEIGAAHVIFRRTVVEEIIDARVFQITVQNADDPDVFANSGGRQ